MCTHAVDEIAVDIGFIVWTKLIHIADGNSEPGGVNPEILEIESNIDCNDSSEEYGHSHGMQISPCPSPWVERLSIDDFNVIVVIKIAVHPDFVGI